MELGWEPGQGMGGCSRDGIRGGARRKSQISPQMCPDNSTPREPPGVNPPVWGSPILSQHIPRGAEDPGQPGKAFLGRHHIFYGQ